ncbi:ribonuclease HI family protein [Staphylococcus carnosus]|uniref:Ribonuclease H n=1 Tax=Staphylococcus carnosus TaxID=1281 RepID=A0AAJ0NIX8_STACA|nr:ribonuclease HI family protein [Staphylococcus carnosus]KKB26276.1 ribonuclease H [Staphylococcus carnosus]POA00578.1 ribonuclease H [Staphylococcus carnosus]QQS85239.1 ribonuclease HI family protein [Staphylococcus carnosus]QRQ05172.1 ribonuclease HI family protein [Staphylococcus carnosus]UTB82829.1 ribonuclease H [Staphylococcus carnosus]
MAKIFFDAAVKGNPGPASIAVVIVEKSNHQIYTKDISPTDNHSAEWEAFIFALECAEQQEVDTALVSTDSKLVVDSLEKGFTKNEKFKSYLMEAAKKMKVFDLCLINWIPRAQNKEANHHAQQALYQQLK